MRIDFIFDTLCPWSFIAERHLDSVLRKYPEIPFEITFHPIPLSSTLLFSENNLINSAVLIEKMRRIKDRLTPIALDAGITIDFDALPVVKDTSLSYLFIRSAEQIDCVWEALDGIFSSFFCEGRDIGDPDVLCDLSDRMGTTRKTPPNIAVKAALPTQTDSPLADKFFSTPTVVFDKKLTIAGAAPTKIVEKMVETAFVLENEELNGFNNI